MVKEFRVTGTLGRNATEKSNFSGWVTARILVESRWRRRTTVFAAENRHNFDWAGQRNFQRPATFRFPHSFYDSLDLFLSLPVFVLLLSYLLALPTASQLRRRPNKLHLTIASTPVNPPLRHPKKKRKKTNKQNIQTPSIRISILS